MKDPKELTPEQLRKREQDRRRIAALRQDPELYAAHLANIQRWKTEHPQATSEAKRRWREANREYSREYARQHYSQNLEYRTRKRESMKERHKRQMLERPFHPCRLCSEPTQRPNYCSRQCAGKAPRKNKNA
jgi:hypothetical protein